MAIRFTTKAPGAAPTAPAKAAPKTPVEASETDAKETAKKPARKTTRKAAKPVKSADAPLLPLDGTSSAAKPDEPAKS
ncbi:hypothetical protein [Aminobacter sp. HY435]|uniref:hypothetical protein n=1 Tax=Aminobacter sp. HY435 TaxID=2970917 RepID=UPI0022B9889A|nr:hypothetical protein [Aminobacter sp. HY435]